MHLLSRKKTVLIAVFYGLSSFFTISWVITGMAADSPADIIFGTVLFGIYVFMWIEYLKAFKTRLYDRRYARAKIGLYGTLQSILPLTGNVYLRNEDTLVQVIRPSNILLRNWFIIEVLRGKDIAYDNEATVHTGMVPTYRYRVAKGQLRVDKEFDMDVVKIEEDYASDETSITFEPKPRFTLLEILKAHRQIPTGLRYASIDEMHELNDLLVDTKNNTVS